MATEKRMIDANSEVATIKEHYCKNCDSYNGVLCRSCWADDVIGFFEDAPTVDAVEVVRCKDCKYYREGKIWEGIKFCFRLKDNNGENVGYNFSDDDFCSRGERKDNG